MAPRKRDSSSANTANKVKPLTNGEVVEVLRTLPEDQPFGVLLETGKREFFRQLYVPLRSLFNTTTSTSQANRAKVSAISHLEVLPSLHVRFDEFEKNPLEFWERNAKALPQYSGLDARDRVRTFLEGAAQLDLTLDEQLVLRRFVAVSTYSLFRRAFPKSPEERVFNSNIKQFLTQTGLSNTEPDIKKYGSIIRRGQRHQLICRKLMDDDSSSNQQDSPVPEGSTESIDDNSEDYGPLFFSSIPDTLWEPGTLNGNDTELCLDHLRRLDIRGKSQETNARHMAKVLLNFHSQLVWLPGHYPHTTSDRQSSANPSRPTKRRRTGRSLESETGPETEQEHTQGRDDLYIPEDFDIDPAQFNLDDFDLIGPHFYIDNFEVVEQ